MVTRQQTMF